MLNKRCTYVSDLTANDCDTRYINFWINVKSPNKLITFVYKKLFYRSNFIKPNYNNKKYKFKKKNTKFTLLTKKEKKILN